LGGASEGKQQEANKRQEKFHVQRKIKKSEPPKTEAARFLDENTI